MSISKQKLLELTIKKKLNSDFLWAYKSAFKGTWLLFSDLREYVVWDSVKSIDWKTSAKHNDVYVKNYEEERDLKILFMLDLSPSIFFWSENKTKLDLLLEIFYILCFSAVANQDKIWFLVYNWNNMEFIDFKSWEENIFLSINKIEKLLKTWTANNNSNIDALKKLEHMKLKDSLIFILSDKLKIDNKLFKHIWTLNELIYINIFDYFENNLSDLSFSLNLWEKSNFLNLFLKDRKKLEKYKIIRKQKIEDFSLELRNNFIDHIVLDTRSDIFREFSIFFNKRINI